jgi:NADPH2:quinone reductase
MVKTVQMDAYGGPEVMRLVDIPLPGPGPGQVTMRNTAIGFNFIDTYHRTGLYPLPLPATLGVEAAGVVEKIGDGVTTLAIGDRIASMGGGPGAYCEARNLDAAMVNKLPEGLDDRTAAASMLKGLTSWALLHQTFPIKGGETVLIHAAAGGVGLILCQWAKHLGATVIGTVGTDEKATLAKSHGCDHVIVYTRENFTDRVREITGGKGVPVVYDSVGKDTFTGSLDCLAPLGLLASFGNASGPVEGVSLDMLSSRGSLFVTRMTLGTTLAMPGRMQEGLLALYDILQRGAVKVEINHTYKLDDIQQVHIDAESRKTSGSIIIEP